MFFRLLFESLHQGRRRKLIIPLPGGTMNMLPHALYGAHPWARILADTLAAPRVRTVSGGRIGGQTFFQKHQMAGAPQEIETTPIKESSGKTEHYLTLPNTAALVACAQIAALEVHLWGSRNDDVEKPDRLVLDLDPDEDLPFTQVKRAALDIKALLDSADLPSFAMLTGGKGIHVVLNLKRRHSWDDVKGFAGDLAAKIVELDPKRFVATMAKKQRHGRIFIDFFRNGRGATAVAPYSPRARAAAPIAAPIAWDELNSIASANAFKLRDMRARLREPDPWKAYAKSAVSLTKAARAALGLDH